MFRTKLLFRIALVVALSILTIELIIGAITMASQKQSLLTKRLESLQFSTGLLENVIVNSIHHSRIQDLNQMLSDLVRGFSAYSFTLFDTKGRVLIHQQLKEGYQSQPEGLKERLQLVYNKKVPPMQTLKGPEGNILIYIVPLHDSKGDLTAGLEMETPAAAIDASVKEFIWRTTGKVLLISLAIVLFVIGIITPVLFYFAVKPINEMRKEMESLAKGEGDLTYQITVTSSDEIGEMARWFNAFVGKIRAMVYRVTEHSGHLTEQVESMTHSTAEVAAMSEDVSATIQQIARGAEDQAAKIGEVSHLMQEMQDTMKEVEKEATDASSAVDKATATAKAGGKMAQITIDKMVALNEVLQKNSEMVVHLGTKSKQVGRVVDLISGIAEQTNLLSLNAAIEAARAGEQGRGFAVVASEVRILADGASKATQEITTLVQEMQDETQAVVESMEKSSRDAQIGKDGIRQMETTLDEIVSVIENVVKYSRNIKEMVAQQSQRYTKIAHSIQDINAVSEESAASTEEVSASTEEQSASMEQVNATCKELAGMAQELKSMVEKFKIR
ncbi:MAG TPA: methyl-accepting chemotaxis protein [bacterium]